MPRRVARCYAGIAMAKHNGPDAGLEGFVVRVGLKLREDLRADEYRARYLPAWENMNGYAF